MVWDLGSRVLSKEDKGSPGIDAETVGEAEDIKRDMFGS